MPGPRVFTRTMLGNKLTIAHILQKIIIQDIKVLDHPQQIEIIEQFMETVIEDFLAALDDKGNIPISAMTKFFEVYSIRVDEQEVNLKIKKLSEAQEVIEDVMGSNDPTIQRIGEIVDDLRALSIFPEKVEKFKDDPNEDLFQDIKSIMLKYHTDEIEYVF